LLGGAAVHKHHDDRQRRALGAGVIPIGLPLLFTANDCLDIGTCLGGPVSLDYYDRAPFPFTGTINNVNVRYTS
jgi:hypothetical protein